MALLGLLVLADWLFFDRAAGLSLALFGLALFAATVTVRPIPARALAGPALLAVASVLPVIEHVQTLSLVFLVVGVALACAWAQGAPRDWARPLLFAPIAGPRDALVASQHLRGRIPEAPGAHSLLTGWALPLGGALVLVSLMAEANPVVAGWLDLSGWDINGARLTLRAMFWTGLALILWPMLRGVPASRRGVRSAVWANVGGRAINPASVARALVVFNLLLAVQTTTDAQFLWVGTSLPDGMSYAEYAHRGAYPLLATALLAIVFAVLARLHLGNRTMRGLLVLWLVQNVVLTASSGFRLSIYVDVYGLTYLRLHAAIWMGLVAGGLTLALWQVARDHTTHWLVGRGAIMGIVTLYLCCFVNFAAVVAEAHVAGIGTADPDYVCALPDTADGVLADAGNPFHCSLHIPEIDGWRDWGFRNWHVRRTMAVELSEAAR